MTHSCFPITPIIMKLHTQTPHESRMCSIDFGVERSRSQCIDYRKWFMLHNFFSFTIIIIKLHTQTTHESRMCYIMKLHIKAELMMWTNDFWLQRSKSQYFGYWKCVMAHNCFLFTSIIMKLHTQIPHELLYRFWGPKNKVSIHWLLKMFSLHNCFPFTSIIII